MSKEADKLGGGDNPSLYRLPDTRPSCDKGDHKKRSIANQPNHLEHWKKVDRKNINNSNTK